MSAHRFGRDAFDWTVSGATIPDPGNGGTIDLKETNFAVCELTVGDSAETRSLPSLGSLRPGIRLVVVLNQVGTGSVVVGSSDFLTGEGQSLEYVAATVNGSLAWVSKNTSLSSAALAIQDWRVWDALGTPISTAGNDDLGILVNTFLTSTPKITSGNVNNTSATRYARMQVAVPQEYIAGSAIFISIAWQRTDAAQVSGTLDVEACATAIPNSDVITTDAQNVNGAASGNSEFYLNPATISPGMVLDIRVAIALNDTGGSGSTVTLDMPIITFTSRQ